MKPIRYKVAQHIVIGLGGISVKGNTVQCLRPTEKRSAAGKPLEKVVLTIDRWANELSPKAKEVLTLEEQELWREWKSDHDEKYRIKQLELSLDAAPSTMYAASAALREREKKAVLRKGEKAPKPVESDSLWKAIDALIAALEETGHERPKKPRGRPAKPAEDDDLLLSMWPHGDAKPLPNFATPGTDAHGQYEALLDTFEAFKRETLKAENHK